MSSNGDGHPVDGLAEKYYKKLGDFPEFWYFYLAQHMKTGTRAFHYVGTWVPFVGLLVAIYSQMTGAIFDSPMRWLLVPAGILVTYILGFYSHWTIEKNQPATFAYPLLSVGGDLKMFWLMTLRQNKTHVEEVRRRLATGWVIDRHGFYPPDYAQSHGRTNDLTVAPAAVAAGASLTH